MMGVVTDLARGKMYDIEEMLLKDGFTDTDSVRRETRAVRSTDEGWPHDLVRVQGRAGRAAELGRAAGDGAWARPAAAPGLGCRLGSGSAGISARLGGRARMAGTGGGFQNSALGGMLSHARRRRLGGGTSSRTSDSQGGRVVHPGPVLDVPGGPEGLDPQGHALTMKWQVLGSDRDMQDRRVLHRCRRDGQGAHRPRLEDAGRCARARVGSGSGSGSGRGKTARGSRHEGGPSDASRSPSAA